MSYAPLQAAAKYFQYYIHASHSKGHGMHSPFVFEFITRVMNDFTMYEPYHTVEALRRQLLKDTTLLQVVDLGAGSAKSKSAVRTVAAIAKNAAKPKKFGQLMYRMVQYYQCRHILELGTSLGITTAYLALGNKSSQVITMEGADAIAHKAIKNFNQLGIKNVSLVQGNFDDTLPGVLTQMPKVDLVFIDGNHRQEPTIRYFEQLLPHVHNDTLLIFDDIHWSKEMEAAWQYITAHEAVTSSIDLFYIGIVSFRKEFKEKQAFSIKF